MIPRIRGRQGQAAEGPYKDKWFYEIQMWNLSGEQTISEPHQFGPYETEAQCLERGREIVRKISDAFEKEFTGEISGRYLDMKNGGIMRPWDEQ